eukprot:TRINITY_DN1175_c0_g1_i1.p1 TRINITY_DN1175_c0_g1~~TRINITY_DN1175_c0_g1_i1.p1  ORF type:complete len:277 (+),score=117.05 TRINITY_DN1175_c0_g1_i1:58-888(+)
MELEDLPKDPEICYQNMQPILEDINNSSNSLGDIINYCSNSYDSNKQEVFSQTQQYAGDAILNIAYHVHRGAVEIHNYLDVQLKELDKIDIKLKNLTCRTDIARISSDNTDTLEYVPVIPTENKHTKIEEEVPMVEEYERTGIDFNKFDEIGICLSKGGENPSDNIIVAAKLSNANNNNNEKNNNSKKKKKKKTNPPSKTPSNVNLPPPSFDNNNNSTNTDFPPPPSNSAPKVPSNLPPPSFDNNSGDDILELPPPPGNMPPPPGPPSGNFPPPSL